MLDPQATLKADPAAIRQDLAAMTARWAELREPVMLEIRAFAEGKQPQNVKFSPDWLEDAVTFCADMNARGYNIYAVRNPIRQGAKGSATDADIVASFFLWADCDDEAAAGNVRQFPGPKWTMAVITGTQPSTRVHTYWELQEPCRDMAVWRAMQQTIAAFFGSDASVINPSRIMRVGGTVSHPFEKKRAKGYVPELVQIKTQFADARQPVTMEQMARVFGSNAPARPLSQQAKQGGFQIDTGAAPSLDRERLAIQAMQGVEWHGAVIRLVASYVAKGLSDSEIHALTQPLTLAGYTGDETAREVQTAIDGARRKGWAPEAPYATPDAITAPPSADTPDFNAPPAKPTPLEWFDDVSPSLTDAYLIKGVLSEGAMSVVYGPSNSGKTFFALDVAFHVAIGAAWRGQRVGQASVLYLAAEGGRGVLNRIAALRQETGICDVPLALRRAGMDLLHDQADLQAVVNMAAEVKARLPDRPQLIVIDTLSRIMAGGDENSAQDMTALIRNIDAIREVTGAHIMLVHHTGKDTARGARGHSSLRAATDTEIEVGNEGGARAAMVTKQRDYSGNETFPFTLKSVELGQDQDGDAVTSCVVETVSAEDHAAQAKQSKGLGGNQKVISDTFNQMLAEGIGKPNRGGVGMPEIGTFWCVELEELRRIAREKMVATDTRSAFNQAMKALTAERGLFVTGGNMVWRTDRKVNK